MLHSPAVSHPEFVTDWTTPDALARLHALGQNFAVTFFAANPQPSLVPGAGFYLATRRLKSRTSLPRPLLHFFALEPNGSREFQHDEMRRLFHYTAALAYTFVAEAWARKYDIPTGLLPEEFARRQDATYQHGDIARDKENRLEAVQVNSSHRDGTRLSGFAEILRDHVGRPTLSGFTTNALPATIHGTLHDLLLDQDDFR